MVIDILTSFLKMTQAAGIDLELISQQRIKFS